MIVIFEANDRISDRRGYGLSLSTESRLPVWLMLAWQDRQLQNRHSRTGLLEGDRVKR
jgi:hypothetical protein